MLPIKFLERLEDIVAADDLPSVMDAMRNPSVAAFRVNTLRTTTQEVISDFERLGIAYNQVGWYSDALWVMPEHRGAVLETALYADQKIYAQNLSSMVPPLVLNPQPGHKILDLAAAPGSKTLQLACLVQQEAELAAVEVVKSRFFKLRENLKRQGADRVRTFLKDGQRVWRHRPAYFDCVLLDAPCSSEGRFKEDDPHSYSYWSERKITEMVRKQKKLLFSAIQSLRPGGTLVYSTCSLAPEENEGVITRMLRRFEGELETAPLPFTVEDMRPALASWRGKPFNPQLKHARRILPSSLHEGFFVCKMVRTQAA